jgi:hypothetical protein
MFDLDLAHLLAAKGGRPMSVASLVSAIFLPSSLLVYFTRPDLFGSYGIAGGILFGAACGFPVVAACCFPWYALYWAGSKSERIEKRLQDAVSQAAVPPEPSLAEQVTTEDPFEWPTLLLGGWTANGILYGLVALAYYRPIILGATLLLTVAIVLGVWLVLALLFGIVLYRSERKTDSAIELFRKARNP